MDHVAPNLNLPADWDRLIEAVGPAALLVTIDQRLSAALKSRFSPEDILQEALLHAWRDRAQFEWRGVRSFRNWLLTLIDHRISAAAEHTGAQKRGGDIAHIGLGQQSADSSPGAGDLPAGSTTPSRVAIFREQAAAMHAALESLPEELRDVVRLRLFEQLTLEETAARLGLPFPTVRYRFGRGAEQYQAALRAHLVSRSLSQFVESSATPAADPSP